MDKHEEEFHEIALKEVASNDIRPGVMAKALIEANGNKEAAVLKYMNLRVEQLMDEHKQSIRERLKRENDEWIQHFSESFTDWTIFVGKRIIEGFVIIIILCIILVLLNNFMREDFRDMFGAVIIFIMIVGLPVYLIASIVRKKTENVK